jgi:hypothetical protein
MLRSAVDAASAPTTAPVARGALLPHPTADAACTPTTTLSALAATPTTTLSALAATSAAAAVAVAIHSGHSQSDPYVRLSLGERTHRSKTCKKTNDPVWEETFLFKGTLRELLAEPLQLQVMTDC